MWFDQNIDLGYEHAEPSLGYEPAEPSLGYEPAEPSLGYEPAKPTLSNTKKFEEEISSKKAKPPRRRRSVGFTEEIQTHEVEKAPEELAEEVWYSKDEYDSIKAKNSSIIRSHIGGERSLQESQKEDSIRGLEHKIRTVSRARRENKFNAMNAVMEEQDRQLMRGISDPSAIAAAYRAVAARCQDNASKAGMKDAENSLNYSKFRKVRSFEDDQDSMHGHPGGEHARPHPQAAPTHVRRRIRHRQSIGGVQPSNADNHTHRSHGRSHGHSHNLQGDSHSQGNSSSHGNSNSHGADSHSSGETSQPSKKKGVKAVIRGARRRLRRASM